MRAAVKNRPKNFSVKGFIKLVRFPNLVIIAIAQYLTAIYIIGKNNDPFAYLLDYKLLFLCVSTGFIAAAGYIINDYYDVKIDYINKPHRVIVGTVLKRRMVMVYHTLLNVAGISIGLFLSLKIGAVHALSAFLLWLYSNYLKRQAFFGNFIIALLTAVSILVVDLLYLEGNTVIYNYALFAFLVTLIREIIKDMEDLKGDASFGCRTIPIIWGIRKTKWFIYSIIMIFAAVIFYASIDINSRTLTYFFLLMGIPSLIFIYRLIKADTTKDFNYLSNFCKFLMLLGIISMMFL